MPTQRACTITFSPSLSCTVAFTGQTGSQGAFSQCMQGTGWKLAAAGAAGGAS